ncbi:GntR family transcriptional regulator [Terrilactibacillus laevilacticus]|uniref:GntR family transcriptional regulator n=1 Tax=Terrilactibacillus laevilacticus TaxID=1380157 RepID=A0ABW5PN52_9BACI|nr:GntR family transcriptional regulator [Terrilactibacillus laevilacticus]
MDAKQVGSLQFMIDFSLPLYEQILNQIRSSVAKGEIGLGEKLPSVREMAHSLKVNPNTVMRAYQELERDGLTEKRRGQGTFITHDKDKVAEFRDDLAKEYILNFINSMENLGFSLTDIQSYLKIIVREGHPHDRNNH